MDGVEDPLPGPEQRHQLIDGACSLGEQVSGLDSQDIVEVTVGWERSSAGIEGGGVQLFDGSAPIEPISTDTAAAMKQ